MAIDRRGILMSGGALIIAAVARGAAAAHEYEVGKLKIEHPWLRAPKDGETHAHLFMLIHNSGEDDRLVGVKSANIGGAEFHVAPQFAALSDSIYIPAGSELKLAPGGSYVDLLGIKKMNPVGWGFEMTLVFAKAGEVTIDAAIDAPDAMHAHDAEAMERWEKAHEAERAPAGQETHHEHEHMNHEPMDRGSTSRDETDHDAAVPAPPP